MDELSHGILGEIIKGHKYIHREENDKGSKNRYTYFYTQEAWDSFKKAKNTLASGVESVARNVASSISKGWNTIATMFKANLGNMGAKEAAEIAKNNALQLHGVQRYISTIVSSIDGALGGSYKKVNVTARYTDQNGDIVENRTGDTNERGHKYIGKIRMPPKNEWRYYYTDVSFEKAIATYNYRKSDDPYMNKFDTIDVNPFSNNVKDLGNDSNPGHRSEGDWRGINCVYCTLATELRVRGYNVQAKDTPSIDGRDSIASIFGLDTTSKKKDVTMNVASDFDSDTVYGGQYSGKVKKRKSYTYR